MVSAQAGVGDRTKSRSPRECDKVPPPALAQCQLGWGEGGRREWHRRPQGRSTRSGGRIYLVGCRSTYSTRTATLAGRGNSVQCCTVLYVCLRQWHASRAVWDHVDMPLISWAPEISRGRWTKRCSTVVLRTVLYRLSGLKRCYLWRWYPRGPSLTKGPSRWWFCLCFCFGSAP